MASGDGFLNAGELDREITLQQLTPSDGADGFPVDTWSTLDTVWAAKDDISAKQRFSGAQLAAPFDCTFRIYYRADMDPELLDVPTVRRVVYLGRRFRITYAQQLERLAGIELQCLAPNEVIAT